MPFVAQKILALVAAVALATGGNLCWCVAAGAVPVRTAIGVAGLRGASDCHSAGPTDAGAAPASHRHHACCDGPGDDASAVPSAAAAGRASPPPARPHAQDPQGSPASAHCHQCTAQITPTPDAKSAAPPAALVAIVVTVPDRVADWLVPTARPFLPRVADSPPPRDGQTLLALGCSLLD